MAQKLRHLRFASLFIFWAITGNAFAQTSILTIDSERVFAMSDYASQLRAPLNISRSELAQENQRLILELEEEEQKLTELRNQVSREEFQKMAEAFDQKVKSIRAEQDRKEATLERGAVEVRTEFFNSIRPIISQIMAERQAEILMERSAVIWTIPEANITNSVIERIDAQMMKSE